MLLSHHVEVGVATQLLAETPQHLGYLLKDRVADPAEFAGSPRHVAEGGTALGPKVVAGLLADPKEADSSTARSRVLRPARSGGRALSPSSRA